MRLPRTGHELLTCHYPFYIDSYEGCNHKCIYCYADNLKKKIRIKVKPKYIEKILKSEKEAVKRKIAVRLGARADCFQKIEKEMKITKSIIEILNLYAHPYIIVTKSPLVAEYTDIIEEKLAVIQFTITTLKEEVSRKLEPNAPLPSERLKAMKNLHENGYRVIARLSPIIPKINLKEASNIMEKIEAKHIIVEFLRAKEWLLKCLNLKDYIKKGYYYRYDLNKKMKVYEKLSNIAHDFGLKFSICSDGDPVPYYLNDTLNCCGIDFKGVERVASMIYKEAKNKEKVTLKDMEKYWHPMPNKFIKAWLKGEFERYVYGLKWHKNFIL